MPQETDEVQIDVCQILIDEVSDEQILVYKEVHGDRTFPFILGTVEAWALVRIIEGGLLPRPLTHETWFSTITEVGGKVLESAITRLKNNTFFAEIRIKINGNIVCIDSRPSDAVVIAIMANVPLYVNANLLAEITK